MSVRAKFHVGSIEPVEGNADARRVRMQTVYDDTIPEDQRFSKATPWGQIEMQIDNPAASAQLEVGKTYYVDFTPVG